MPFNVNGISKHSAVLISNYYCHHYNFPKHVEFLDKYRFGKIIASVGFIKKKYRMSATKLLYFIPPQFPALFKKDGRQFQFPSLIFYSISTSIRLQSTRYNLHNSFPTFFPRRKPYLLKGARVEKS